MCNMPKVAPILFTYFADPELWAEFHLMKMGHVFFTDASWLAKVMYMEAKSGSSSPSSYLGEGKKEKKKKTFFRGQENI